MPSWTILLVAVGISVDAFAVALVNGVGVRKFLYRHAVIVASIFAVFQVAMPLLGWFFASQFAQFLEPVDHWIAFVLLVLVGAKMIVDAFSGDSDDCADAPDPNAKHSFGIRRLLILGVATSIDAAAIGVSFAVLDVSIWSAVLIIGVVTWLLSFGGVLMGQRVGLRFRKPAEIFGGLVLIAIGARILAENYGLIAAMGPI